MTIHEIKTRQAARESYEMDSLLRALSQAKQAKTRKQTSRKARTNAVLARWGIPLRLV